MERSEAWFVAIVAAAIGFIAGMAWFDANHQVNWLYEYQTLITGALAVAAAFVTVNAMNKTEERQQLRHDELMSLNLRADRLRARRAEFPYARHCEETADKIRVAVDQFNTTDPFDKGAFFRSMCQVYSARVKALETINADSVTDAKKLFGSKMSFTFDLLQHNQAYDDRNVVRQIIEHWPKDLGSDDLAAIRNFVFKCQESIILLQQFALQLIQLKGYYEVAHGPSSP